MLTPLNHFLIASLQVPSFLLSCNTVESAFTDRKLNQARAGAGKIYDPITSWLHLLNFAPLPQRGITDFNALFHNWAVGALWKFLNLQSSAFHCFIIECSPSF